MPIDRTVRYQLLPYGTFHCADGREVLFDRNYLPLWQRATGGPAERADPSEWVANIQSTRYAYGSAHLTEPDMHAAATAVLVAWGLPVPTTADLDPSYGARLAAIRRARA